MNNEFNNNNQNNLNSNNNFNQNNINQNSNELNNNIQNNNQNYMNGEYQNNPNKDTSNMSLKTNTRRIPKNYWIVLGLHIGVIIFLILLIYFLKGNASSVFYILLKALMYLSLIFLPITSTLPFLKNIEDKKENLNYVNYMSSNNSIDDKLLVAYLGKNYESIINKKYSITAFVFNFMYLLYRKLYLISIALFILILLLSQYERSYFEILYSILVILLGLFFNKIFIKIAKWKVNKIKLKNPNLSENELIKLCEKKGGTSILGIIILYIIIAIIGIGSFIVDNKNVFVDTSNKIYFHEMSLNYVVPKGYIKSGVDNQFSEYVTSYTYYKNNNTCDIGIIISSTNNNNLNIPNDRTVKNINGVDWIVFTGKNLEGFDNLSYYETQKEDYLFSIIVGENDNASCENMADRLINSLEINNMKDKNE